jgi:hypothetical protein
MIGAMKNLCIALLFLTTVALTRCLNAQSCTPYTYNQRENTSCILPPQYGPITTLCKSEYYTVRWPDGKVDYLTNSAFGQAGTPFACVEDSSCFVSGFNPNNTKSCWPQFDSPYTADGYWSQVAYDENALATYDVCEDASEGEPGYICKTPYLSEVTCAVSPSLPHVVTRQHSCTWGACHV